MRLTFVILSLVVCSLSANSDEEDVKKLLTEGRTHLEQKEPQKALPLIKKALTLDPRNVQGHLLLGHTHEMLDQHREAVEAFSRVLQLDPNAVEALDFRGSANFKAGRIAQSVADFDRFIKLRPEAFNGHWRRGISLYYAGKFEEGRKQFEGYEKVDTNDVENAVWHFLCVARKDGIEKARASILKIGKDRRIPMMTVYELFRGKVKPEDVLKAAEEGDPPAPQKDFRLFYAHLYLGLYYEVTGDPKKALHHLTLAAEKPRVHPYMWDVARVHRDILRAKKDK
jgi:lipoprotein NlpI